jgi:pilus assembly protein Flp/PilA
MLLQLISLLKVYFPELNREEGQGMAEYGLILALIAVVVIVALAAIGTGIDEAFRDILTTAGWTLPE